MAPKKAAKKPVKKAAKPAKKPTAAVKAAARKIVKKPVPKAKPKAKPKSAPPAATTPPPPTPSTDDFSISNIMFWRKATGGMWMPYPGPIDPTADLKITGMVSPDNSGSVAVSLRTFVAGSTSTVTLTGVTLDGTNGFSVIVDDDDNRFPNPSTEKYSVRVRRDGPNTGDEVVTIRNIQTQNIAPPPPPPPPPEPE